MTNENNPLQAIADVVQDVAEVGFKALDTASKANDAIAFTRLLEFCEMHKLSFDVRFVSHYGAFCCSIYFAEYDKAQCITDTLVQAIEVAIKDASEALRVEDEN